jgi:membrane protein implicated in regulation of membrane protease activity
MTEQLFALWVSTPLFFYGVLMSVAMILFFAWLSVEVAILYNLYIESKEQKQGKKESDDVKSK